MTIKLQLLAITGLKKEPALLTLYGISNVVFGPTDTGKSYIAECIRFALGSNELPENIGVSEGYSYVALQLTDANNVEFTLFREFSTKQDFVYAGLHLVIPQQQEPIGPISDFLLEKSSGVDKKILNKTGILGNLTVNDLRRVSIFDEIETLNNVTFDGEDNLTKTRNKAALCLILTGVDDSKMHLVTTADEQKKAKGHVEAIVLEIESRLADVPVGLTLDSANESLLLVSQKIESVNKYFSNNVSEIEALKEEYGAIEEELRRANGQLVALNEAKSRFILLQKKYKNDVQRLEATASAADVISNLPPGACPLCKTDLSHQGEHLAEDFQSAVFREAAIAEAEKIKILDKGLSIALLELDEELVEHKEVYKKITDKARMNRERQYLLLTSKPPEMGEGLELLSENKSNLAVAVSNLERVSVLEVRLEQMTQRTKRVKQIIARDISSSAQILTNRIKKLLELWNVPNVDSVYFDDTIADIEINQRRRISYGKGKRGIFLTAYMVALMERAIDAKHPHLGFVVIDSPLVTYKDPKHSKNSIESDDLLEEGVSIKFYNWLANRKEPGQIIVLENEEPPATPNESLEITEFFGPNDEGKRVGFFPVGQLAS